MTNVPGWTDSLPYALFRANQAIHRRLAEQVDGLGVTITQLGILVHLEALGHMSGSDLARHFKITPQSVSTALGHLESLGWVQRLPHPVHKRVVWYEVTPEGAKAAEDGRSRVAAFNSALNGLLGGTVVQDLTNELLSATTELDGPEPPPGTLWPVQGGRG